ncbi:hypothetical protein T484DRAFT_1952248 [Baffinella frigidus]|nr:hypothetical protein T484DRAFT_1952248 [Cryptophyta sp. CCMP2293]
MFKVQGSGGEGTCLGRTHATRGQSPPLASPLDPTPRWTFYPLHPTPCSLQDSGKAPGKSTCHPGPVAAPDLAASPFTTVDLKSYTLKV